MEISSGTIVSPGREELVEKIDTEFLHTALARGDEVAFCNQTKAPELLSLFSSAYSSSNEILSKIEYQMGRTKHLVNQRSAVVMIEEADNFLTKKAVKSTKETREAVIDLDSEVIRLRDVLNYLECLHTLWAGYRRKFEMDYGSVRKILERNDWSRNLNVSNQYE
jgi:hypothetical protein